MQVETRRNGQIAVRFEDKYLQVIERAATAKPILPAVAAKQDKPPKSKQPRNKSTWMKDFLQRPAPSFVAVLGASSYTYAEANWHVVLVFAVLRLRWDTPACIPDPPSRARLMRAGAGRAQCGEDAPSPSGWASRRRSKPF